MTDLSPAERKLRATKAAHVSWQQTDDTSARTAPGTAAFLAKFEDQVDPERILTDEERARRARHAMRAYMAGLALKSAKARRLASEARRLEAEVRAEREVA